MIRKRRKIKQKQLPLWAEQLVHKVVKENSHRAIPLVILRKRTGFYSTGVTYTTFSKKIIVRLGSDEQDQRLVLIHELAHWICPKRAGHNMRFWRTAFMLYEKYGIDMAYAYKREKNYKKKAVIAFNQMKGGE